MSGRAVLILDGFGTPIYIPVVAVDVTIGEEHDADHEGQVDAELEPLEFDAEVEEDA